MAELFADTSGLGHLLHRTQAFHSRAVSVIRSHNRQGNRIVTTNYVISELVPLMTQRLRLSRNQIVKHVESLRNSPSFIVVHVDRSLDAESWKLLKNRQDKNWSLVDCASFVVMSQRGITQALTTDHHFEQAGFVRLLR